MRITGAPCFATRSRRWGRPGASAVREVPALWTRTGARGKILTRPVPPRGWGRRRPRLTKAGLSPYMRGGGVAPKGAAPASLRARYAAQNGKFRCAIGGLRNEVLAFRCAGHRRRAEAASRAENKSEENLPAQQARPQAPPRFPGAHEDGRRPKGRGRPPRPWPQASLGVSIPSPPLFCGERIKVRGRGKRPD